MDPQPKIEELKERFKTISSKFDPDIKQSQQRELEAESLKPTFWDDRQTAQKVMKKIADINTDIETYKKLEKDLSEIDSLVNISEGDAQMMKDSQKELKDLEQNLENLEIKMFLSGPHDRNFAILSIHAGQGGTEAMDWVEMLSRMYQKFFAKQKTRSIHL